MKIATEIDRNIMQKRWAAYPLLVKAVQNLLEAFSHAHPNDENFKQVDRAVQLLVLLGEIRLKHVDEITLS